MNDELYFVFWLNGKAGSYAEKFANENGIAFVSN